MNKAKRKSSIQKIRRWLRRNSMTAADIGIYGPVSKAGDALLESVLDDIADDDAREQGKLAEEREAAEHMLDEEGE